MKTIAALLLLHAVAAFGAGRTLGLDRFAKLAVRLGDDGAVEVVRAENASQVVDRFVPQCDRATRIETAHVTGGEDPEVVVRCGVGTPQHDWIWLLRWEYGKLELLNANDPYVDGWLHDVDADGKAEILVPHSGEYEHPSFTMFRYAKDGSRTFVQVPFIETFVAGGNRGKAYKRTFAATPGKYEAWITRSPETDAISDATVIVNGVMVLPRSVFASRAKSIRRAVVLHDENTLQVMPLAPKNAAFVLVFVPAK